MGAPLTRRQAILAAGGAAATAAAASASPSRRRPASARRRAHVPAPVEVLRTDWSRDPFSLGSYSYAAVGATPGDRRRLGNPPYSWLSIAGEATSVDYPGTVHGALLSGQAAASELCSRVPVGATVVVVGAGAAGLAAARVLHDRGRVPVVLEARRRIGGRVWTVGSRPGGRLSWVRAGSMAARATR